jgi:hypothetical protein
VPGFVSEPSTPRGEVQLEATAAPKADLFIADKASEDMFGPFLPLVPTLKAGTARTLYGIANSTYEAGEWDVELSLENPVDDLGTPVDLFPRPTLVRGSEEERTLGERLRADVAARARQELEGEIARLKVAHTSAVGALKAQQQKELEELKASHAAQVAEIENASEAARAEAEAARQELSRAHEARLAAMRQEHAAEEARAREALESRARELRARHEQELARLEQEHAAAVERLKAEIKQRQGLLALEQEKHRTTEELITLQKRTSEREEELASLRLARRVEELAGWEKELTSQDRNKRLAAFEAALASDDEMIKSMAQQLAEQSNDNLISKQFRISPTEAILQAVDTGDMNAVTRVMQSLQQRKSGINGVKDAVITVISSLRDKQKKQIVLNAALGKGIFLNLLYNTDLYGSDSGRLNNIDIEECVIKCIEDKKCKSLTLRGNDYIHKSIVPPMSRKNGLTSWIK